jgi:predicted RNase H-like HicB family nuclease
MTRVYSIILIPDNSDGKPGYTVHIPDFDIGTQGRSLSDALYMAQDAIYQVGLSLLEEGLPVPEPSRSVSMPEPGLFIAAVEVDFNAREASPIGVSPKLAVQR